jgi:hypothetical protein
MSRSSVFIKNSSLLFYHRALRSFFNVLTSGVVHLSYDSLYLCLHVLMHLQNPSDVQVLHGGPGDAVGIDNYVKDVQLLLQSRTVVAITGAGNSVVHVMQLLY